MNLIEQIKKDFIIAMKEKNISAKNILGNIKTEIVIQEKIKPLSENECLSIIQKEISKLDSVISFEGIKNELKNEAIFQKSILIRYLPDPVSKDEILLAINNAINANIIQNNIGSIMKFAKEKFQGKFDMKELSNLLKK